MNVKTYIEQAIQEYNKVIFLPREFLENIDVKTFEHIHTDNSNILILSAEPTNIKEEQLNIKQIDEETAKRLYALYHTYEFADNFMILEQNSTFASVLNYIYTGILTAEEAWQALLEG